MPTSRLAVLLLSSVAVTSGISASMAPPAIAQQQTFQFNIPAEDLDTALKDFARTSRQQISFDGATVKGKQAPALVGSYSADAGLDRLLAGSGFVAQSLRPGLFVITTPVQKASAVVDQPAIEQVVVTGSHIAQESYNSPSPVAVTAAPQIARSGESNLYDVLNRSPQFGVGVGPASADQYNGEVGASFINLRGLGTNRTLVLINGQRRVSGSSTTSAVDLSTIPAGMVQRIEVVTGGAAAVYGADAVSGAVNIILKDEEDGLEFNGRQGISSHGDAESFTLGVLGGGAIGERGRITIGLSYNHEDPLFDYQRSFGRNYVNLEPNPANTGPSDGIFDNLAYNNSRFPNTTYSGAFAFGNNRYTYDNGQLRPLKNDSLPYGPLSFLGVGGDGFNGADFNGLRPATSVAAALVHFTYNLFGDVTLTTDIQFAQNHATQSLQPLFGFAYPISRDNPYLPAPVAALMDANHVTTLSVGRTDVDQGLNVRKVNRETYTGAMKLDGQITSSVAWSAFAQYGRFDNSDAFTNERIISRFNEALDVVQGPTGPQCRSATARANGCAPLNIFGANVATQQALAYFHYTPTNTTTNTQTVVGGQISGNAFDLPAGPVAFSAGAEYRKETTAVLADGLASTGQLYYGHGGNLSGQFDVSEQYGEVLVPLLSDVPLVKTLQVDAAVRESEYSTIGNTFTWKAGLVYAPVDDLHFRVTQSRSVRAPNLSELFNSGAQSQVAYLDPCDSTQILSAPNRAANCHALGIPAGYSDPLQGTLRFANTIGNPALSAETSNSTTLGIVVQPSFLEGFSASVDYYDIRIKGAINTLPVNDILSGCYAGTSPNALLCSQIVRRADGGITFVKLSPLNIGAVNAQGIDFSADYHFDAGQVWDNPLRLGLSFAGNYDLKNDAVVDAAHPENTLHYAGSDLDPKFRGNLTVSADAGPWSFNWTFRYISSTKADLNVSKEYRSDNNLSSRLYNDLYVEYDFSNNLSLGLGLNNIFDVSPPYSFDTYTGNGNGSLFDNVGRYFFLTVNYKT